MEQCYSTKLVSRPGLKVTTKDVLRLQEFNPAPVERRKNYFGFIGTKVQPRLSSNVRSVKM